MSRDRPRRFTLKGIAAKLGLDGCEIFPKQVRLDPDRGDIGNWIIMPYFGDTYGGKLCEQVGVRKTGGEMLIDEFVELAEERRVSAEQLAELAAKNANSAKKARVTDDGRPLPGAPECLRRAVENGVPGGKRNEVMFNLGVFATKAHGKENLKGKLFEYNAAYMKPLLTDDEVELVIKSLAKKDYSYRRENGSVCCSACEHPSVCAGLFGSGGDLPTIIELKKVMSEPPTWTVLLPEGPLENLTTNEWVNFRTFNDIVYERYGRRYPSTGAQKQWDIMLNATPWTEEEPPAGVGEDVVFLELLTEFLTGYQVAERDVDLLTGRPWDDVERGRLWFRMREIGEFISRSKALQRHLNDRIWFGKQIRKLGGDYAAKKLLGHTHWFWWVPSPVIRKPVLLPAPEPKPEVL